MPFLIDDWTVRFATAEGSVRSGPGTGAAAGSEIAIHGHDIITREPCASCFRPFALGAAQSFATLICISAMTALAWLGRRQRAWLLSPELVGQP